jgi:cation diffusion facilitator family transporter
VTPISHKLETPETSVKISIAVNVLLLILKFIGGFWGGSKALIADFINSLLDLIANFAILIGIRVAKRPADAEHHYGHGNADVIAAFLVAVIVLMTGVYIGYDSAQTAIEKNYHPPHFYATGIALFTIVVKTILYRYTKKVGRKSKSAAVLANAQDHKSDVFASTGALFGIIMAQVGYPILDPLGGIWVSVFIVRNSVNLIRGNIHTLMSGAPDKETIELVKGAVNDISGVMGISFIRMRTLGSKQIVDIAILVDKYISVEEGHKIASNVQNHLIDKFEDITEVMVHIEPKQD